MTELHLPPPTDDLIAPLNDEQRQAVLYGDGPLLVLAGAGSGKTRVIAHRIAHLVARRDVAPASIAALTFTNRAARELTERVAKLVGPEARQIITGTFHSFGARLLRRYAPAVDRSSSFVIYDDEDQLRLLRSLLADVGLAASVAPLPALRSWIDRVKSSGRPPDKLAPPAGVATPQAVDLFDRYQRELQRADAFDFGDLIARVVELVEQREGIRAELQRRFVHLLVDEYQDTSPIQDRMIEGLAGPGGNLVVVGDDDQAIYGWRGASARNILTFPERHAGCTVVRLEHNYRSRTPILEAANAVIGRSAERLGKVLRPVRGAGEPVEVLGFADDRQEALGLARLAAEYRQRGGDLGDIGVLYRTASLSRRLEEALQSCGIPYSVLGGLRFFDRAEVKDLLAWARFLVNPKDGVAAQRAMTAPRCGLGDTTLARLRARVEADGTDWLAAAAAEAGGTSGRGGRALTAFVDKATTLRQGLATMPPSLALEKLLVGSGLYEALSEGGQAEDRDRLSNLQELLLAAAELEQREPQVKLADFLEQAALSSDTDASQPGGRLALLTLHAAKGLEFPVAVIVGLEEGTFPLGREDTDMEEERRLCYVGMTRARERLVLTWARLRRRFTDTRACEQSRFLRELPREAQARRVQAEESPWGGGAEGWGSSPGQPRGRRGKAAWGQPVVDESAADPFPDYEQGEPSWPAPERAGSGCGVGASSGRASASGSGGHGRVHPAPEDFAPSVDEEAEFPLPVAGERVTHASLGEGEVVQCHGVGPSATISVLFPVRGVKRVQLRYLLRG